MHFTETLTLARQLETLDDAWDTGLNQINGNAYRPVYGSFYRSEHNKAESYSITDDDLDRRQQQLRKGIGCLFDDRKESMFTVSKIALNPLIGSKPLVYKYCPATTFAMEELIETRSHWHGQINHVVMQLSDDSAIEAQNDISSFNRYKQRIGRALRRALGDGSKGFFVLERNSKTFLDKLCMKKSGLHMHAVIYTLHPMDKKLKERLKLSFSQLMGDKKKINNALSIYSTRNVLRDDVVSRYKLFGRKAELDIGLADYLSKEMDKPIVDGTSNFSVFNMSNLIHLRRRWRYQQQQAIRKEVNQIRRFLNLSIPVDNIEARVIAAKDAVKRPPELLSIKHLTSHKKAA